MSAAVRIFRPAKTAMQSGRARTHQWVIEFEPAGAIHNDPLMGWPGALETSAQVKIKFSTKEEALAYAERQGWAATVQEPTERIIRPKSYADNFAFHNTVISD